MAEQLTPQQIADYKRLLEKEKTDAEISNKQNEACAIAGVIGGAVGSIGGPVGIVGGAALGCATGMGAVDIYYKTGLNHATGLGNKILEEGKKLGRYIYDTEIKAQQLPPAPANEKTR